MSNKGIGLRYVHILALLRIFKGTFNIISNGLGKCKIRVPILDFVLEIQVESSAIF